MTIELILTIAAVVAVLSSVALFAVKAIRGAIDGLRKEIHERLSGIDGGLTDLSKDHQAHKLHVAENYMQKTSFAGWSTQMSEHFNAGVNDLKARLIRIENRLDKHQTS